MSMKKDELCKLKIDIQTNNLFRYREIAVLVDKPKFLEEVKRVREIIGLDSLLPFISGNWFTAFAKWVERFPQKEKVLMAHSKRLCREFNRPLYMVNDIYQAILFGKVIEERVSVGIIHPKTIVEKPYVAIFPTPYTTDEDIKKSLDQAKEILKGNSLLGMPYNFKVNDLKHTEFSQIEEHRELYWRNMAGESYTDIAFSLSSKEAQDEYLQSKTKKEANRYHLERRPYVIRSIQRYKKAIETE